MCGALGHLPPSSCSRVDRRQRSGLRRFDQNPGPVVRPHRPPPRAELGPQRNRRVRTVHGQQQARRPHAVPNHKTRRVVLHSFHWASRGRTQQQVATQGAPNRKKEEEAKQKTTQTNKQTNTHERSAGGFSPPLFSSFFFPLNRCGNGRTSICAAGGRGAGSAPSGRRTASVRLVFPY